MVRNRIDVLEQFRKQLEGADVDLLRDMVKVFSELLMGAEVDARTHVPGRPPGGHPIEAAAAYFPAERQRSHRRYRVDQCLRVRRVEPSSDKGGERVTDPE